MCALRIRDSRAGACFKGPLVCGSAGSADFVSGGVERCGVYGLAAD